MSNVVNRLQKVILCGFSINFSSDCNNYEKFRCYMYRNIRKRKTFFCNYCLSAIVKKQEQEIMSRHGFSFLCGIIKKLRLLKPPGVVHVRKILESVRILQRFYSSMHHSLRMIFGFRGVQHLG